VVRCSLLARNRPCLRQFLSPCIGNGHFSRPRSVSFQTPRTGPHFRDSSGLLFSMYSRIVEAEDNKMTEHWQKDADGILIFVSPHIHIHIPISINWIAVGRFILCRRRDATFRDAPGLEAESPAPVSASGELGILSQEHLSISLPPKRVM
jgi:hypothetical protein